MSSLASSQSSLPSTPPSGPSASSSFYSPTALALTASGFLRRFYTEPTTTTIKSQSASDDAPHHHPSVSSSLADSSGDVYTPPIRHASPFQPPPLYPLNLQGFKPSTGASAQLLSRTLAEEIRLLIPPRMQLVENWNLAYSLERDGVSLTTLYEKCDEWRGSRRAFVVVIKDRSDGVSKQPASVCFVPRGQDHSHFSNDIKLFGAYLSDAPQPSPHYYGTGECFLWRASILSSTPLLSSLPPPPSSDTTNLMRSTTVISASFDHNLSVPPSSSSTNNKNPESSTTRSSTPEGFRFKAFPYSGVNDYMIYCQSSFLSVGGG